MVPPKISHQQWITRKGLVRVQCQKDVPAADVCGLNSCAITLREKPVPQLAGQTYSSWDACEQISEFNAPLSFCLIMTFAHMLDLSNTLMFHFMRGSASQTPT